MEFQQSYPGSILLTSQYAGITSCCAAGAGFKLATIVDSRSSMAVRP
jgi:hypothetical protein